MMHRGWIILDLSRQEKQSLTVEELVAIFHQASGVKFAEDRTLLGRRELLADAMGVAVDEVVPAFRDRMFHPVAPTSVSDGPVAGPYITAGLVIRRDPVSGLRNISINRMPRRARGRGAQFRASAVFLFLASDQNASDRI